MLPLQQFELRTAILHLFEELNNEARVALLIRWSSLSQPSSMLVHDIAKVAPVIFHFSPQLFKVRRRCARDEAKKGKGADHHDAKVEERQTSYVAHVSIEFLDFDVVVPLFATDHDSADDVDDNVSDEGAGVQLSAKRGFGEPTA